MGLVVEQHPLGPFGTNCYIVRSAEDAPEAVVVDPSDDAPALLARLAALGSRCTAILVTHGHVDHIYAVADLAEATGAPVYMPEGERESLESPVAPKLLPLPAARAWVPDVLLTGGETVSAAGISFAVMSVPGHSPAHLSYYADGSLFSGDVLFAGSVGRTDLDGGDWPTLRDSIDRLLRAYPADTVVCPGHNATTTLGAELATNPFLADLRR
jgi:hydroxyacylglutathione hydrolase